MIGPLPSGSNRIQGYGGFSVTYGTPVTKVNTYRATFRGIAVGAKYSALNFSKPNYQGLRLPGTTTATTLRTLRGAYFVPIIKLPTRGIADSIFSTVQMSCVLSGAHDITALTAYAGDIFGTVDSHGSLYISPNLRGNASQLFVNLTGTSFAFTPRYMQASASSIGTIADASVATIARIQRMTPTVVSFDAAIDSTAYLYTYNFTVGNLKLAASLAW